MVMRTAIPPAFEPEPEPEPGSESSTTAPVTIAPLAAAESPSDVAADSVVERRAMRTRGEAVRSTELVDEIRSALRKCVGDAICHRDRARARVITGLSLLLAVTPAVADTFGGFSGVDTPYLVNRDRIC